MLLFSIIVREFRQAARKRRTHWLRLVFGTALLTWFALAALKTRFFGAEALGQQVYFAIVYPIAYGIVFVSPALAASSIARERREGTLGLLFLTHLRPLHIVLAKYTALIIEMLGFLCLAIPFYSLPIILGGVAHDQIISDSLQLLGAMLFCTAVGVCASSYYRNSTVAFFVAVGVLVFLDIVFQILLDPSPVVTGQSQWLWVVRSFVWTYEPCMGLYGACNFFLGDNPAQIPAGLVDLGLGFGLGLLLLAVASRMVPRTREVNETKRRVTWLRRLRTCNRIGNWLAAAVCVWLVCAFGAWATSPAKDPVQIWDWAPYGALGMELVLAVLVARAIAVEKESATLETLVSLPLSNFALVNRGIRQAWRQCWGWYLLMHAPLLIHAFFHDDTANSMIVALGLLDTFVGLAVIFGFGSFCSLYSRDSTRATVFALILVGTMRFIPGLMLVRRGNWGSYSEQEAIASLVCLLLACWVYWIATQNVRSFAARQ